MATRKESFEEHNKNVEEFRKKKNKIYLAYIEEYLHIHPTAEVRFEEDWDADCESCVTYVIIGGFESGIKITDSDIMTWFIDKDIRPSEIKDYSVNKQNDR